MVCLVCARRGIAGLQASIVAAGYCLVDSRDQQSEVFPTASSSRCVRREMAVCSASGNGLDGDFRDLLSGRCPQKT